MTDTANIPASWIPLLDLFRTEMTDHADELDFGADYCWESMTAGWAVAKGLPPDDSEEGAIAFSEHVRYHTDLA